MAKKSEKTKSQQAALNRLSVAYEAVEKAKANVASVEASKLVPAMQRVHETGIAYREIGEVIGVSHVTVMRMMRG